MATSVAHRYSLCRLAVEASCPFAVDQPVQKSGFFRNAPMMPLALSNVRVQVIERFHVNGSEAGDFCEARDFCSGQSNVVSEADHRRPCQQGVASTIFALF
ncbi:hypothetical protein [Noviherbaspirillum sp. ST9]|uniref:hypothetical protein n=1 Tax=Noviherbaspirillum sp. ST9 TaxID=3401606 RepID=UPI003B588095